MSMNRSINLILLGALFITLSACSASPDFESYSGRNLDIAVIGEPPEVNEDQVMFDEISFDVLSESIDSEYDAIFVMPENLNTASDEKYADIYSITETPIFFITAKSHIPFTNIDTEYSDRWHWSPGENYAIGFVNQEDNVFRSFGFSIYNGEETPENIKEVYSRILTTIESI
ncbi:hypothetical protein JMA_09250 [Jeotgalibacillus malaysiensis]|uniref:Lipoprotein n=1 Tax=Jeotgalibacillus malaysiensis TaxID=1508404 RepID=A0A0B5ANJ4_9BACL|nr:hypothetical protein [Jeotgalibacillus malaysiensis]AJD90242.1 hypothetical protein JMA_09250 [Jeotgalibacillus malaysiensis]